jgi:predicted restriction endonuclease
MEVLRRVNYRKIALEAYAPYCCVCGFGVVDVLEVAHLNGNRSNNDLSNLAVLCPNCHKMHDLDLIPTRVVVLMRNRKREALWSKRMKDAGQKAAATREKNRLSAIALRAVATRRRNERLAMTANAV